MQETGKIEHGQRLARRNHLIRTGGFAYTCCTLALHGWERDLGAGFWIALLLSFLVYPHLVYLRARLARDPRRAEELNCFLDAVLFGMWTAGLHFPTWVAYPALASVTLNAIIARGVIGALISVGCFAAGAALWVAGFGFQYWPATSHLVSTLCFFGALGYSSAVGFVVHRQWQRLVAARNDLRTSEARYRLISENAGDLIAMISHDGRWLYTSPSYQRVLAAADIEPGADAFRRVHPDDADHARVAVLRSAATGKPRELAMRLVDREGRVRQYKVRVHPIPKEGALRERALLVSEDETDLHESEERLLLAAHALEGMTEAIVITSAGGTVTTVNRAFCEITGYSREEVLGQPEKTIRNTLEGPEFYDQAFATVQRDGYWSGTTSSRRKNGSVYREWRSIRAVRDASGTVTHYVIVFYEAGTARHRNGASASQA